MGHQEEARAKFLNETSELLFSSRHKLMWTNFYTPDGDTLAIVKSELELALSKINAVIDGDLFPKVARLIVRPSQQE